MSSTRRTATLAEVRQKEFLGHPVGLWALFTTEMWERFCYYGMRALLVLYLISTLTDSNPGFGWTETGANKLYGIFTGLVYLTPLIGGFIADRLLGQHRSVLLGGFLMALGEFALFFSEYFRQHAVSTITPFNAPGAFYSFMGGLALIVIGNGFFKPCISVMVGDLYKKDDPRRDAAFGIFYMGINVGAFLAPFVAGSIGENISWHWGFLTAGVGMLFGLCTYSLLRPKFLGPIGRLGGVNAEEAEATEGASENEVASEGAPTVASSAPSSIFLTKVEKDRIVVILVLTFFCIAFWSVFEQAGTSLNIFAKKETNRQVPAAIGMNLPGFLPNQDELDSKISMNELQSNLARLDGALRAFEDDFEKFEESSDVLDSVHSDILTGDFDAARDAIAQYESNLEADEFAAFKDSLDAVVSAYESTDFSLKKANAAREKAGQSPLDLSLEKLDVALEKGLANLARIDEESNKLYQARIAALGSAIEDEVGDAMLQAARTDVLKKARADFLASESEKIDREKAIWTFPTTWYQSVNALAVVIFVPIFNLIWGFLRKRNLEPSTPVKFGVGLIWLSIAFLFMILGALQSVKTNGNAAAYWLLCTYVFCTFGELCLSPVGLSMVSRLAPPKFASLLMGVWFLSSAVAGYLSGFLAAVLGSGDGGSTRVSFFFGPDKGLADFFLIMTLTPFIAGVLVFILAPKLRKMMHENE